MKKTRTKQQRMNLYLDHELESRIRVNSARDFLRPTTWVTQYLRKTLLKNNCMSNSINDES